MKKFTATIFFLTCFIPLSIPVTGFAQEELLDRYKRWVEYQKAKIENISQQHARNRRQAELALARSRRALRLAEKANDPLAIEIARSAVQKSRKALQILEADKMPSELYMETVRLEAVRKAISLNSEWRKLPVYQATRYGLKGAELPREYGALMTASLGEVSIETEHGRIPFDGSHPLKKGDRLFVGQDSYAELQIPFVGQVKMGPNSSIRIGGPTFTEKIRGYIHWQISCHRELIKNQGFFGFTQAEVNACRQFKMGHHGFAIGVRGTELVMESPQGEEMVLIVLEGRVEVDSSKHDAGLITASSGEKMLFDRDGRIQGPWKVDLEKIYRWWNNRALWEK